MSLKRTVDKARFTEPPALDCGECWMELDKAMRASFDQMDKIIYLIERSGHKVKERCLRALIKWAKKMVILKLQNNPRIEKVHETDVVASLDDLHWYVSIRSGGVEHQIGVAVHRA